MELRIYKSNLSSLKDIENFLKEETNYEYIESIKSNNQYDTHFELYLDSHEKSRPIWIKEVEKLFKFDIDPYVPKQFNGIIIAKTSKSIYLVPKGYAFHIVEKIADLNFGMDIAERKVPQGRINLKASDFIQQNKMREVSNYKSNLSTTPIASESVISIVGALSDSDELIFGRSIECGQAVAIGKKFNVDETDSNNNLEEFYNVFNEMDIALQQEKVANYPRVNYIESKSKLEQQLDEILLENLVKDGDERGIYFDVNKIMIVGGRLSIVNPDDNICLNVKNKPKTKMKVEIDDHSIYEYVKLHKEDIKNLSDLRCSILSSNSEDSLPSKSGGIKEFIFAEIEFDGKVYLLSNGRWGNLTESFFQYLKIKLDRINKNVDYNDEFDYPKDKLKNGNNLSEDDYIKHLCMKEENVQLHKKFILKDSTKIEIADIYNKASKELYAIKIGTNTGNSIYSFDQSNLATHALKNASDFTLKSQLKKHKNISTGVIDNIVNCQNINVLWVADGSVKYIHEGVSKKEFDLNKFKSFLLKLKIVDWFDFAESNGFQPKIYFSKVI